MPEHLQKILYTAEAVVDSGREGHGRSVDGRLDVDLSVPEAMGGGGAGTNPEQLFAVGYAACFQSALFAVATGQKLNASESQIICRVGGDWPVRLWRRVRGLSNGPIERQRNQDGRADSGGALDDDRSAYCLHAVTQADKAGAPGRISAADAVVADR